MNTLRIGLLRGNIELKQFLRQKESVVFTLFFPLLLLVIFGSVFKNTIAPGVKLSQYFISGMIASGLVSSGFQQLAINIPMERDTGALKRLRGTPMSPISFFIGKTLLVFLTMLIQVFILLLAGALFFHVHIPNSSALWFRFLWVVVLGSACSTVLGIALAGIIKSGRGAAAVVTPIVLVLQFSSGVFFQYSSLPSWMQQLAAVFPLKWLTQGMRSVFLPNTFASQEVAHSWELGRVALVLAAWLVAGTLLATRSFKWSRQ
jgi:ABC-2 type transport system permease protein